MLRGLLLLAIVPVCSSFALHPSSRLSGSPTLKDWNANVHPRQSGSRSSAPPALHRSARMQLDPNVLNFALGAASGAISSVAVFPIEFAKTKMQNAKEDHEKKLYSSTLHTMKEFVRQDGMFGLWNGVTPVILGSAPESAIQLATHSAAIAAMMAAMSGMSEADLPLSWQVMAGAVSGFTTVMVTNPMEVLRIKASSGEGQSMFENIKELGIKGLFSGCDATWLRDIPFSALYFPLYAVAKQAALGAGTSEEWQAALFAGLVGGLFSSFITTPLDVIKTRVQSDNIESSQQPAQAVIRTPLDIIKARVQLENNQNFQPPLVGSQRIVFFAPAQDENKIRRIAIQMLEEEGWKSFFCGAGARVGKLGPGMAITLVVFEVLQKLAQSIA